MEPEQGKKIPIRLIIILLILIIVLLVTLIFVNLSVVSVSVIRSEPAKDTFAIQPVLNVNPIVRSLRNEPNAHLPFDVGVASGEKLSYPHDNFYFNVLPSWTQIATSTIVLPYKITNPLFAITNKDSGCFIAYTEFPKQLNNGDIYNQTRYSYQFYNTGDTISVNRGVDSRYFSPNDLKLTQDRTPYLPYEIAYSYYPYKNVFSTAFVLFMPGDGIVPERCDEDFVSMLSSLTRHYDSATVTSSSQGDLFIKTEYNNGKIISRLLFKDIDTKIAKGVKEFENGSSFTVYDNKLFYINSNGLIFSLDPISKQEEKVFDLPSSNQLMTDNKINDFYIYKNRLFYLYGPPCLDYLAKCNLQLYEYDMTAKKSSFLAGDLVDRSILAYDKKENRLHLMYGDGDGGCGWWHNHVYDFSIGKVVELDKGSSCDDDPDSPVHELLINKIRNLQNTQMKNLEWLHISGNNLLLPQSEIPPSNESLSSFRYITSSP